MYRSPILRFAVLLFLCVTLLASPPARAQDMPLPAGAPGFAIGAFDNGHTYAVGQTFNLPHGGTWGGARIPFSANAGEPSGAVRWELRRWIVEPYFAGPGKLLAVGAWTPVEMTYNDIQTARVRLEPGTYALLFITVEPQPTGSYWNVLATAGQVDRYDSGDLVQWQVGQSWRVWAYQDMHGEFYIDGATGLFVLITE